MTHVHIRSNSPTKAHADCRTLPHRHTILRLQQLTVSPNFTETEKVKKTEEFVSIDSTRETPEKTTNEIEINNLPGKEFKALVIRMLTELGKRIDEQ